ncbi:flagellar hook capping FlgD N-terminal domain-containing protein [Paenibacillus sacheonensis]|uniref:Flagellar hook capping protein n=1 Tax=Paenibacillus sacheonensis TaxID=742054 RepID=A0A7X4YP55_9BACL|nr:flagellar hook capping FlgD N-terminal domain-containing protein [Paenibacillus sacheonensis]MBM7564614.1 flagellar basal-body rod modification protein FlgD [Paenibacillus sacheonensis]NBC69171.1 flagellar hook capping protein [Paenibacillus sacheonensis]
MADRVSTTNVWPYYSASNVQAAAKKPEDTSMGKDDFLRILVTQLQNQDPMQPLQDKDFIAQMAQFSSVEQLVNMSDQLTALRQNLGMASTMIGKNVQWYDYSETGEMIPRNGVVDSIVIKDKVQYARVGNQDIDLKDIVSIGDQVEGGDADNG